MKKGLLLSLVASTVLFAGGDIAPVEPVADAPAAACNDFYGEVGAYDTYTVGTGNAFGITSVLGATKDLFGGLSMGVELQGAIGVPTIGTPIDGTAGNISQLYLAYSIGNTALKVGRFAIPKDLSPLHNSDATRGLKTTYDGAMFANTDLADTTVYGGYIFRAVNFGGATAAADLAVLGFQNKSLADTTITVVGTYGVKSGSYDVAAKVDTVISGDLKAGFGADYAKGGAYNINAYVSKTFSGVDAKLAAKYASSGAYEASLELKTALFDGTACAKVTYASTSTITGKVGYSQKISGIDVGVGYELTKAGATMTHAISAKAVYKF
jgi:hypothetical protein